MWMDDERLAAYLENERLGATAPKRTPWWVYAGSAFSMGALLATLVFGVTLAVTWKQRKSV